MPGMAPSTGDERQDLLAYLAQERYVLRLSTHGLSDDQARLRPSASSLSLGGLVKHATAVERMWASIVEQHRREGSTEDYQAGFEMRPGETLGELLSAYEAAAQATGAVVSSITDLGHPVPVPRGVPWFPRDLEAWTLRWVLLHLITETARHAGHADIIRETIDGATAFPLMAAAEGWEPTPWIQPWQPGRG